MQIIITLFDKLNDPIFILKILLILLTLEYLVGHSNPGQMRSFS